MSKLTKIYECSKCNSQFPKWSGRCLECGQWGSLEEGVVDSKKQTQNFKIPSAEILEFDKIETGKLARYETKINEFDRVLGGGFVPGSVVLLSGEPGIGKSTIVLQVAGKLKANEGIVYISGEESAAQIKERLQRLEIDGKQIKFISETCVERILSTVNEVSPALVIVDSIQTVSTAIVESEPGSISQIRASTSQFLETAKKNSIAFLLIGHITKDGAIAGPKSLEHIVDTVVYLEADFKHGYRILRATKNRFGSVNELGIFAMTDKGLTEVSNPAGVFLETTEEQLSGTVISSIIEGTRPFLIEIQALVTKTVFGYPQRKASGYDLNRLQILTAVLTKRAGVNLTNQDVLVNVVGGLKVNDPSLDLAVCLAIVSSLLNQVIDRKTIVLGEVGLSGEIRQVGKLNERLQEAKKLGFNKAIVPKGKYKAISLELDQVGKLEDVIKKITGK